MQINIATKEDLYKATGHKRKSLQIDWLKKRFKKFQINKFGNPVITQEELFDIPYSANQQIDIKSTWQPKIQV